MNHFSLRNFIISLLGLIASFLILPSYVLAAQIKMAWDANTEPDLAGYKVYYVTASGYNGGFGTPIDVGNVTTYTITGLTQGQTYYIAVTAYDNAIPANESGYSDEVSDVATDSGTPLADTTPPTVLGFTIPATSFSLTVSITTFAATDNIGVTGYIVTESATAPVASATGWTTSAPTSYVFTSAGAKTLYAWAKDAAGNVSASRSASVTISLSPTAPTPLNDTGELVKQLYRDFLNREADPEGLQYWVNQIDSGAMTRAQVIESFFWSEEFGLRIAPIVRLYFAYFLRIPDYAELQYWINQHINGQPLESISDAFAASQEFQQQYGSLSNEQFVTLVYQNVLGRSLDPGGSAYWVGQLNSGALTRGQVMIGFSESTEYKGVTSHEVYVTMMYMGMLRRAPEEGGFNFWVDYLDSGNSGLALIDGFLISQEYANRF